MTTPRWRLILNGKSAGDDDLQLAGDEVHAAHLLLHEAAEVEPVVQHVQALRPQAGLRLSVEQRSVAADHAARALDEPAVADQLEEQRQAAEAARTAAAEAAKAKAATPKTPAPTSPAKAANPAAPPADAKADEPASLWD